MKRIIFSLSLFYATALLAHGFSANTLVHLADGSRVAIEQLCYRIEHRRVHVASSNPRSNKIERKRAQLSGSSTSNCYLRLSFCDSCNNGDFVCTPSQPFYLHGKRRWIQAGDLQVGDALRAKSGKAQTVTDIQFVPESIDVYTLCIKKTHTFYVGTHGILTHNMLLPALPFCLKLSCAIGSGAAAGCACVPMIGPVAIGVGVSAVVLASCIMSVLSRRHVSYRAPEYDIDFLSARFDRHADNTSSNISPSLFIEPHEPIRQGGCRVTPPELQERVLHTGGCGNAEVPTTKPVIGCGGVPPHLEHRPNSGGCGYIEVPKIEDLVLSYQILAPELSLVLAQDMPKFGEKGGAKVKPRVEEYAQNVGRVSTKAGNMQQVFEEHAVGELLKEASEKTKYAYKEISKIYKVIKDIKSLGLKEGDLFYLDVQHYDHIEVFKKGGKVVRKVLNLDGTTNEGKTQAAVDEARNIRKWIS